MMVSRRQTFAVLIAGALAALTACSGAGDRADWKDGQPPQGPIAKATIVAPAADAKDVPASVEIEFTTENADTSTFELTGPAGKVVAGQLRPDGSSWVPNTSLAYGKTYTAKLTATGSDGKPATATHTFTIMAKPANSVRVSTPNGDGWVVGVGMPMIISFGRDVPKDLRDDVQRRMWAQSTPAQEGTWHWFSAREVHYRPKSHWQPGTKLSFRVGTGGMPLGGDWYGRNDITWNASVRTDPVVMTVSNATKHMTVTHSGRVERSIPVSLGKTQTPSSSGNMIVMTKDRKTVFDTTSDPNPENRYVVDIEYAQRLTWGGEFIHAAPWSVAVQGRTNVSHGCVNVSMDNAAYLFELSKIGDPVTVQGTERPLQYGNGWTDWNLTWDEYVKGSALPYTPPAPPAPPSAAPSPTPGG